MIERNGYKIETSCECPPIPVRSMDWCASIKDGDYDYDWDGEGWISVGTDPVGYGATEEEAIQDLLEQLEERDDFLD
jgi:hypothetical protein